MDKTFIDAVLKVTDGGVDEKGLQDFGVLASVEGKTKDESQEMADQLCVEVVEAIYRGLIRNREKLAFKGGTLDFSRSEGGNNHTELWTSDGYSYIWLDTHCGYSTIQTKPDSVFAFCGKGRSSCNGLFQEILQNLFPEEWEDNNILFTFFYEQFLMFYREVLARIQ